MDVTIVTTGRADYGLLQPLITELRRSNQIRVSLVATGSHLSARHGATVEEIRRSGQPVAATVDMTPGDDSENGVCQAMARGMAGFSDLFDRTRPDLVVVLGDRFELWAVCSAAVIHRILIAHLHGGEVTRGAVDETVRHSITKMASLHFVSIEPYAWRIIQMGEDPTRVFVVGALGLDNIRNMALMDHAELARFTSLDFARTPVALLTYHPVTLDDSRLAAGQAEEILAALLRTDLVTLATMPNADAGGLAIFKVIEAYSRRYPDRVRVVKNLGQRGYLSAMRSARLMIGNSSSGILESASFRLPVVNVGDRQEGRLRPANVIDCPCSTGAILGAIEKARSEPFARSLATLANPYGDGHAAERIAAVIRQLDGLDRASLLKKRFHDLGLTSPDGMLAGRTAWEPAPGALPEAPARSGKLKIIENSGKKKKNG